MKKFEIAIGEEKWDLVSYQDYDAYQFFNQYYMVFLDYLDSNKNDFLEFVKSNLDNPYLANALYEKEFKFKDGIIEDDEGEYEIIFSIHNEKYDIYMVGSNFWIFVKINKKGYFYYAD